MNLSRTDRAKLKGILDRCYKYVSAVPYTREALDNQEGLFSSAKRVPVLG